jgi:hypothetical protein
MEKLSATDEKVWTNALGIKTKLSEMSQEHLSNIIWFNQIFHNDRRSTQHAIIIAELESRYGGILLPWKPLPIPNEIDWIRELGLITSDGNILGNRNTPGYENLVIGSINHIL